MSVFKVKIFYKILSLFYIIGFFLQQGTLRLYAQERLTAEACIQHEAFARLNQKQQQKRLQRPYVKSKRENLLFTHFYFSRKTVLGSLSTSQSHCDHNNEMVQFNIPFVDSRLSKWQFFKKIDEFIVFFFLKKA